ncbi:MAG: hypothetical protein KAJ19_28495 [Gammaproteobacteria bacterium]|nr:hypothetical protein [Gammaproteobacteria bacterium]
MPLTNPQDVSAHNALAAPHANAGFARIAVTETQVHNAAVPATFTDLDLSSVIGAHPSLVLLKVASPDANPRAYAFRRNGDTDDSDLSDPEEFHCSGVRHTQANKWGFVMVATDNAGIIEWKCASTSSTTVDVVAWINLG